MQHAPRPAHLARSHAHGKGDKGFPAGNNRAIDQASCERASCAISMCAKVPGRVSAWAPDLPFAGVDRREA